MRTFGLICVFVGVLVTSLTALGATRVSVSPAQGRPGTKFTVSFVVDRKLSQYHWLTVRVVSPIQRGDCEYQESADVTFAPKGRRVDIELRPFDRYRWCPGVYRGTVRVENRVVCGGSETSFCSTDGPFLARFSFTVKP